MITTSSSDLLGPVLVRRQIAAPDIAVAGKDGKGAVEVRLGSDRILDCTVTGKPKPECAWMMNDVAFCSFGEGQTGVTSLNRSTVTVKNAGRTNACDYVISAKNSFGEKVLKIKVVVFDKPGAPENVKISKVFANSINISWKAPVLDGGANISNYVLAGARRLARLGLLCQQTS